MSDLSTPVYPANAHLGLYHQPEQLSQVPLFLMATDISITQAEDFAPRITSSKGETDLDGTLHHTFPVDHGFSKVMSDDNQNYRVVGDYNPVDGTLYPSRVPTTISTGSVYTGTSFSYTAKATNYKRTYVANRINGVNAIWRVFDDGTFAAVAGLPAAVTGSTCKITSMVFHKDYLYFTGKESSSVTMKLYRYDFNAGTTVEICSDSFSHLVSLRNTLYATYLGGVIWSITNETATTATATRVKEIGPSWDGTEAVFSAVEFNGAIWVAKYSGLYRFDGVDAVKIIHHYPKFLTNHQGALYYINNGWLYRFNGSLVEKVQYFGDAEAVTDLQSHLENLYILTIPNVTTYKYSGTSSDGTIDYRIFEYDGVNFRVFSEADTTGAAPTMLSSVGLLLLAFCPSNVSFACAIFNFDLSLRYKSVTNTAQRAYVITSDFDGDLPNINKLLRRIQVDVDTPLSTDSISVSFQFFQAGAWKAWSSPISLTTLSSSTGTNIFQLPQAVGSQIGSLFEIARIKLTLTPAVGSVVSLKSFTVHYTVHPRVRRKLTTTVNLADYSNPLVAPTSRSGTALYSASATPSSIKNSIYDYLRPELYGGTYIFGPESYKLKTSINSSITTVEVYGLATGAAWTDPGNRNFMPIFALVSTDGEVELFRSYQATTSSEVVGGDQYYVTSFILESRGFHGSNAQAFTAGEAYVFPVMEVGRARLLSESIDTGSAFHTDEEGSTSVERLIRLEFTEV